MIHGSVNSDLEAVLRLWVRGPAGSLEAEVIVDTGFNGFLVLPIATISKLQLERRSQGWGVLADGSQSAFDIYEALVLWKGRLVRVPVGALDVADPLLGMSLLRGSELAIQVISDGAVSIRDLTPS